MKKVLLIFLIVISGIAAQSQNIEFYSEDLNFEIRDGYFILDGIYYFSNTGEEAIMRCMSYPFPVNVDLYGAVDSISVTCIDCGSENRVLTTDENSATFLLQIGAFGVTKYKIHYRQKLLKQHAEYILTTTGSWKKPLEQASYTLTIPTGLKVTGFSYPPNCSTSDSASTVHTWHMRNFMPDKNMVFDFE